MVFGLIFTLVLTGIILKYVYELEEKNCECARQWQHQFIKYYAPVVLLVSVILLITHAFVSSSKISSGLKSNHFLATIFVIYGIVSIVYNITLVLYFLKLRYSNCECARDWKQYGLLWPLIILTIALLIICILMISYAFGFFPMILKKIKEYRTSSRKNGINKLNNTLNKKMVKQTNN